MPMPFIEKNIDPSGLVSVVSLVKVDFFESRFVSKWICISCFLSPSNVIII